MKIERSIGANGGIGIIGIKVGSEFIVDSYGPSGDNGSFLPFNPAATGAIYTGSYVGEPWLKFMASHFSGLKVKMNLKQ